MTSDIETSNSNTKIRRELIEQAKMAYYALTEEEREIMLRELSEQCS